MHTLPIAASFATDLVRRQLRYGEPVVETTHPLRASHGPVRQVRVALAEAFGWVARSVAPSGYHLAH